MDRSVNTRALSLRPGQRLIAVSDIHGNLRLFNKLLDQVRYTPGSDVLVLAGDLIEKGPQSLDTLRFIMKLSKAPGVYALMGNCDFVCKNIWHRYNLRFLVTAHSKAPVQLREADQYRMVGAALQVLKDHPVIDAQYLSGSLAEQNATIRVVLEKTPQDQLLKIWNNTSPAYKLSFVVLLTGVEIASRRERRFSRVTDVTISTGHKAREEKA